MNKFQIIGLLALTGLITFNSCKKDEESTSPTTGNLTLNITGLEDLGDDYTYENWLIVNGAPVSAGLFDVDATGNMSKTSFSVGLSNLNNATTYVLTIEPVVDSDPAPSNVHILGGDFSGNSASVSIAHAAAIGDDFSNSTGIYILATPTDGGMATDENSGVWWLNPAIGPGPGLALPTLPLGWEYEGWAVIDGVPISTGKFTSVTGADFSAPYSETVAAGPPFPGEDFLINAPSGVNFPTDLAGKTIVISVEPMPDNSLAPFVLKPLVAGVPTTAVDHTPYTMSNNSSATNPTGSVSR